MFDLNNIDVMKAIINSREDSQYVIPLYVKIGDDRLSLLDLCNYKPLSKYFELIVGFGTDNCILGKKRQFLSEYRYDFNFVKNFSAYNDDVETNIVYMVFETSKITLDEQSSIMHKQINDYIDMLTQFVHNLYDSQRFIYTDDEKDSIDF